LIWERETVKRLVTGCEKEAPFLNEVRRITIYVCYGITRPSLGHRKPVIGDQV
jgi:hypothetical protein